MTQLRLSSSRVLLTTCYSWTAGSPQNAVWWSFSQELVHLLSPMLKAPSFRTPTSTGLLRYRCNRWLEITISQIGSSSWTPARRLLEKFWSKLSSFRKKGKFKNPRHVPRRKYALTRKTFNLTIKSLSPLMMMTFLIASTIVTWVHTKAH